MTRRIGGKIGEVSTAALTVLAAVLARLWGESVAPWTSSWWYSRPARLEVSADPPGAKTMNAQKGEESMTAYCLYYSPGACSLALHIVLEEIGEPFEVESVSAAGDERKTTTPEYRAINPKGRVPALREVPGHSSGMDGVLAEAGAILLYLARRHPEANLLPADAAAEARCLKWLSYLSTNVHAISYGQIWRPGRFVGDEAGCAREKKWLSSKGVAFTEKDIREDKQALKELTKLGSQGTPTTVVDGKVVIGFDPKELGEKLGL